MKKTLIIFLILTAVIINLTATENCKTIDNHRPCRHKHFRIEEQTTRADSAHGFDVTHYDITMSIDDASDYIEGSVTATVEAEETITEIVYELTNMTVNSVLLNGNPATYDYNNNEITIQLGTMNPGDVFTTTVDYEGDPIWNGLGMYFGNSNIFTISDPNASRYWWPCYDHPWDKAVPDMHVTVRDDWEVAGNGILTSVEDNGDGTKTHHWDCEYPMATYLVSLVCQNFAELNDSYEDIPIQNFVPTYMVGNATEDFSNLPFMMEVYSERYGDYPFEKYGNAVTNFATYSAMEHQTMTTLGSQNINGNHGGEMVIAHELAHQWYGNCLTILTWADVWLSEGFATYSEAVYREQWQGFDSMVSYVQSSIQNYYKNWAGGTAYTIYDPPNENWFFTPIQYEKAASVLHMLRLKVGDEIFWQIMNEFFTTFHHSNVITEDFKQVCESVTGEDYQQFFAQWIYGSGIPSYEYTYFFNPYLALPRIMTYVQTSSNSNTDFYLDIPVHITGVAGQDSVLVQGSPNVPIETISITEIPVYENVEFDPHSWNLIIGKTFRSVNINDAYAADGQVTVFWDEFWAEVNVDGYNIYRSETADEDFVQLNSEIITETSYTDLDVENGTTYYYKLKATKDEGYETPFSDVYDATPIGFPLDQGILVIDETKDGNGSVGNATDEQVDEFYQNVITTDFTEYDYFTEGAPNLALLSNYSTIIWHDDDLTLHYINDNIDALGNYLVGGGNLLISGWKTAYELDNNFIQVFTESESVELSSGYEFTDAISDENQDLALDPEKLIGGFNGTLPFISLFPDVSNEDAVIYNFHAETGSQYEGVPVAIGSDPNGTFALMGIPLYFFDEDDVRTGLMQFLANIGEVSVDDEELQITNYELNNFPNPFNPTTTISFSFSNEQLLALRSKTATSNQLNEQIRLEIYNIKGQRIKTFSLNCHPELVEGSVVWNGTDEMNNPVTSGIYFYKLKAGKTEIVKKMVLLK
jgi:hypothetical protein